MSDLFFWIVLGILMGFQFAYLVRWYQTNNDDYLFEMWLLGFALAFWMCVGAIS